MRIETKYNLRDVVVGIFSEKVPMFVECDVCCGMGSVTLVGTGVQINCPRCKGNKGLIEWLPSKWKVEFDHLTIGQIKSIIADNKHTNSVAVGREEYMCEETGVGDGRVHHGDNLFPDVESAQKECDKRNKEDE